METAATTPSEEDKRMYTAAYFKDAKRWGFIVVDNSTYTTPLEILETWNDEFDFCRAVYNKMGSKCHIKYNRPAYLYCVMKKDSHSRGVFADVIMIGGRIEIDVSHSWCDDMGTNPECTCDQIKNSCIAGLKECHLLNNIDKCVVDHSNASIREYCIDEKNLIYKQ